MKALFEEFPRPWRLVVQGDAGYQQWFGYYAILAANGKLVLTHGTYTGDGDMVFDLQEHQLAELVAAVNSYKCP